MPFLDSSGLLQDIFCFLDVASLANAELVCHLFYDSVNTERVWRAAARRLFADKKFVPNLCQRLIMPISRSRRGDLEALSMKELKRLGKRYSLDCSKVLEKADLVSLVGEHELSKLGERECLARYGVRIALRDAKRTWIREEEMCGMEWSIRVRADGPLQQMCHVDPWWRRRGPCCKVSFALDTHSVHFVGEPFEHLVQQMQPGELYFALEAAASNSPSCQRLNLSIGVTELVGRDFTNWGWFLLSRATLWTSFEPNPRGYALEDPLESDADLETLLPFDRDDGWEF